MTTTRPSTPVPTSGSIGGESPNERRPQHRPVDRERNHLPAGGRGSLADLPESMTPIRRPSVAADLERSCANRTIRMGWATKSSKIDFSTGRRPFDRREKR